MKTKKTSKPDAAGKAPDKPKRRRVKVAAGQIVAIPLRDGTYALGHVALYTYLQVILVHFDHRALRPEELMNGLDEALKERMLSIRAVTSDEISDGSWPVIGQREPAYPAAMLDMRGASSTASLARVFFEAYYGLIPWDGMKDPAYYEKRLLPGVPVPCTVRYKRDFDTKENGKPAAFEKSVALPLMEGPGAIHVEIRYPGEDLPTIQLLKWRQAIEDAITSADVGEITDAGGGGGVMDIYVETQDVARALPVVRAAIQQASFEDCARIEVNPLEQEGDDEDPEDATNEDDAR